MTPTLDSWLADVRLHKTRIGIVGLGYVGLPLALLFTEAGFPVTGFDTDTAKVAALNAGQSYIRRLEPASIAQALAAGFHATSDFTEARHCAAVLICVPTPLAEEHQPDMSYILRTLEALAPHAHPGQLIVLESTTWPGTTTELVVPTLERLSGGGPRVMRNVADPYSASTDATSTAAQPLTGLMVAFSPEREDPGNPLPRRAIPKVVGGVDSCATQAAAALYGAIFDSVVTMSTPAAAEMTKLLENIYRVVNIALVNELKQYCLASGIDLWEVIDAASTKPFGFQPFYPGPGVGGHCIPVDPFYLSWKAEQAGLRTRFIELAGEVNEAMPAFVVDTARRALEAQHKTLQGASVLMLGVAYKKDIDDLRESPALTLFDLLVQAGAQVAYNDPFFPSVGQGRKYKIDLVSTDLDGIADFDCVILVTDHSAYDIAALAARSRLFIDTRNATRGLTAANIVRC